MARAKVFWRWSLTVLTSRAKEAEGLQVNAPRAVVVQRCKCRGRDNRIGKQRELGSHDNVSWPLTHRVMTKNERKPSGWFGDRYDGATRQRTTHRQLLLQLQRASGCSPSNVLHVLGLDARMQAGVGRSHKNMERDEEGSAAR